MAKSLLDRQFTVTDNIKTKTGTGLRKHTLISGSLPVSISNKRDHPQGFLPLTYLLDHYGNNVPSTLPKIPLVILKRTKSSEDHALVTEFLPSVTTVVTNQLI